MSVLSSATTGLRRRRAPRRRPGRFACRPALDRRRVGVLRSSTVMTSPNAPRSCRPPDRERMCSRRANPLLRERREQTGAHRRSPAEAGRRLPAVAAVRVMDRRHAAGSEHARDLPEIAHLVERSHVDEDVEGPDRVHAPVLDPRQIDPRRKDVADCVEWPEPLAGQVQHPLGHVHGDEPVRPRRGTALQRPPPGPISSTVPPSGITRRSTSSINACFHSGEAVHSSLQRARPTAPSAARSRHRIAAPGPVCRARTCATAHAPEASPRDGGLPGAPATRSTGQLRLGLDADREALSARGFEQVHGCSRRRASAGQLDRRLAHVQVDPVAQVLDVHDVCAATRHHAQQAGERTGPIRHDGRAPCAGRPPSRPGEMHSKQRGVDVAARQAAQTTSAPPTSTLPCMRAATATAPAPSTASFERSSSSTIASATWSSETVTTSSTCARRSAA